jgi:hypothetical protein
MKTISLVEELIIEASKKDVLINKLGFSQDNAEVLSELAGPLSVWLGNKLIDFFAEQQLERMSSALPQEEEERIRELYRKDVNYRKEIGVKVLNTSGGVRTIYSNIVSIMDWVRIGFNGNLPPQYKDYSFQDLYGESRKWHNDLKTGEGDINYVEKNEILKDYRDENGVGFYWVDLQTNNSPEECNRMGHCGRTNSSNTIYSLRETKQLKNNYTFNRSHLTAAIGESDGVVYQLKGSKNSKPSESYYPYIVDLILNTDNIKGFGSEYDSANDFSITDLPEDEISKIYQAKPELFNTRRLKRQLQKMGIIQDFEEPDMVFDWEIEASSVPYYVDGDWTIRQYKDQRGNTKKVTFIETLLSGDIWELTDGYYGEWESAIEYEADEDNIAIMRDILQQKAGEDYNPDMSLKELIEEYDYDHEIRNALGSAYSDSANSSYYDYGMKQLRNALGDYGEVLKLNDEGAVLRVNLADVISNMGFDEDQVDGFFETCGDDPNCVFQEMLGDYYDKPRFYLDDRWQPDIDRNDFNSYLNDRLGEIN